MGLDKGQNSRVFREKFEVLQSHPEVIRIRVWVCAKRGQELCVCEIPHHRGISLRVLSGGPRLRDAEKRETRLFYWITSDRYCIFLPDSPQQNNQIARVPGEG